LTYSINQGNIDIMDTKETNNLSNVIEFPNRGKFGHSLQKTEKDVAGGISNIKINHINETLALVIPMLFNNIELGGFDLSEDFNEEDTNIKDGSFVVEAIRSLLCKQYDIKHPFQDIANAVFIQDDQGVFKLATELNLKLPEIPFEEGIS
jgi:hypothetical protein